MEGSDSHAVRVVVLSQEEARTPTARAIYPLKHIYQYCLLPALAAVQYYVCPFQQSSSTFAPRDIHNTRRYFP